MYKEQQYYHCLTFNKAIMMMLLVLILMSTVMGNTSTSSLKDWFSNLNSQANSLQSTSQMIEKAISVLNSSTELSTKEKSVIIQKRISQLGQINRALELLNLEIKAIGAKCNQFDGPDCDGGVSTCISKCKTCSSTIPGQCSVCYGNWNGTTCSVCKTGWNGTDCNSPICDSKCANCSSPGQCSVCYGNWNGTTCSTCKPGWTGTDCNTDMFGALTSSAILTNSTHLNRFITEIMNGVSLNSGSPKLLFRASIYDFLASTFHSKCDGKGATIVIVKSKTGAIFGGYTSLSWASVKDTWVPDSAAFIFSLISSTGTERFMKLTQVNGVLDSIRQNELLGPTFGHGCDLYIPNNADTNTVTKSHAEICTTYCNALVPAPTKSYMAGADTFFVSDYEVYTY